MAYNLFSFFCMVGVRNFNCFRICNCAVDKKMIGKYFCSPVTPLEESTGCFIALFCKQPNKCIQGELKPPRGGEGG